MSFPAAQDLKEQVREATDIVALIAAERDLVPKGRIFVALCPFHDDTNPSLQVNPERQTWRCWTCAEGGDVFSYVMRRENVDFAGALRILAEQAGIELRQGPKAKPGSPDDKATLYKAMAWAELQFHRCLLESNVAAAAREYLRGRNITDESIKTYNIGFAPNEWQWLSERARSTPYSPAVLEAIGVVIRKENGRTYDRFRGRVMFPIRDTQNRPIAVGGRILPEFRDENAAKYINSPETRLYSKSEQLYGLNLVRDALERQRKDGKVRNVLVMEGYTDVVVTRQEGITTPIAVCGTALTSRHVQVLKRYADRVTLVLDGDAAGQKRAGEVLELFIEGQLDLRMVCLPDGLDPCDFVLQKGSQALEELIEQSPDALDFCVQRETNGIDLNRDTQQANAALQRILATMSKAPRVREETEAAFRLREQQMLGRIARMFRVDEPLLREQLLTLKRAHTPRVDRSSTAKEPANRKDINGWERELFTLLIQNPDAVAAVVEKVAPEEMRTSVGQELLVIYQEIEAAGEVPDYKHVMDATEDPALLGILAELVDAADRIQADDVEMQLHDLLAAFANQREKKSRRDDVAALQSGDLADQEEMELLNKLFESKRLDT